GRDRGECRDRVLQARAGPEPEVKVALQAILAACADAGIDPRAIDGFASYSNDRNDPSRLAAALGIPELRFSNMQWGGGGGGGSAAVGNAAAAIAAGYADYVVVFRALAQGQFQRFGAAPPAATASGEAALTFPYGLISPAQRFAMRVMRFMRDHGIGPGDQHAIALASYHNAPTYASSSFTTVAPHLYAMAGVMPKDVSVVQSYENFTGGVLMSLVEHDFFTADEANEFLTLDNLIAPSGRLPLNTSGGNLAECYMHGLELQLDAVRQLRGQSPNPVPGARVAMVISGPMVTPVSSMLIGTGDVLWTRRPTICPPGYAGRLRGPAG